MTTHNDDDLNYEIAAAIREGNMRIAIRNEEIDTAVAQCQAQKDAEVLAKWQPLIKAIQNAIPPWAHQFLTHPMISPEYYNDHSWLRRAATIAIPDTATIYAYGETASPVRFRPARYAVSDDDETWAVIPLGDQPLSHWECDDLTTDFHMALAAAADQHHHLPELQAEAERRNAERLASKPDPTAQPEPLPLNWLSEAIRAVGVGLGDGNQASIAFSLIGILEQLQSVITPLYNNKEHAVNTYDASRPL